jgi:hypothetical protein
MEFVSQKKKQELEDVLFKKICLLLILEKKYKKKQTSFLDHRYMTSHFFYLFGLYSPIFTLLR